MTTDLFNDEFLEQIFDYHLAIGIFVFNQKHYFVVNYKDDFELNIKHTFDNYLRKGFMTQESYEEALKRYRGGIMFLNKENFEDYLTLDSVKQFSQAELQTLLFKNFSQEQIEYLYDVIENKLAFNADISNTPEQNDFLFANQISSRLPLFYINFDTKVYLHMNWDRSHELSAYEDWYAKEMDFGYLIPDEFCYWKVDGKDFWKFRQW